MQFAKRLVSIALLVLAVACSGWAQSNYVAGGGSWQPNGSPAWAFTGLYAHDVAGQNTKAFVVVDALPTSVKPFQVVVQPSVGIAQKILTIGKVPIYIPASAGPSFNSVVNKGWVWTTGALGVIHLTESLSLAPHIRMVKSSVSDNSGYQVIGGVLIGWDW